MKNKIFKYSNRSFIVIFIILLSIIINTNIVFADNWVCYDSTYDCHVSSGTLRSNFPSQKNSPLNKICSGSSQTSTYTPTAFIRPCETSTFLSCPEDEYFMKNTFSCIRQCISFSGAHTRYNHYENEELVVACGLGGSPHCSSWSTTDNCNEEPLKEYVCGEDNNSWIEMTAAPWECPSCKELSLRQTEEPILFDGDSSSFQSISMSNYPYRSNTTSDFTFIAFIEACIDRVPIINLNVKLINETGKPESTITGIYAKHNELNYSTENLGLLESFIIPEQDEFKKNYTLQAELNAYRPWAWRMRLITAIPIIVDKKNLEIPGFPTDNKPQTIGDLYFSEDFLGGQTEYDDIDHTCNAEVMLTNTYDIDVLHNVPELSGNTMCDITDLTNYINTDGMTQALTDYIKTKYSLDTLKSIDNVNLKTPENSLVTYHIDNILLNVMDYGFTDSTEFINYISSTYSNDAEIFQYLRNENIITDESLLQKAKEQMSSLINTEEIGCTNYEYQFTYEATDNIDITKGEESLRSETHSLDILHDLTKLESHYMCTISDLTDYYNEYAITASLSDELHALYSLDGSDIINSMTIHTPTNEPVAFNLDNINNLDVTAYGFADSTEFTDYMNSEFSNDEQRFQYLRSLGVITDTYLQQKAENSMSALVNTPKKGCNSYDYIFSGYSLDGNMIISKDGGNLVDITMPDCQATWENDIITDITLNIKKEIFVEINIAEITATWINDIITDIEVDFTSEYDCESSWSWGNLAELDIETLAKCLYNWDACILSEVSGEPARSWPYYEVADCGMGPPSGLMDTSLKDAARGSKTISTQVTIYKTCTDGTNWISSEDTHACIDGKIYKCKFDLSNDVITIGIDVTKVDDGYVQVSQEKAYICTEQGMWKKMGCDSDSSDSKDGEDPSCLNTGKIQGFCGAISGIYQWQENPDDSADSCCCTSSGYWDDTNGCCDAGDSWTSTNMKWICQESIVKGYYDGDCCDSTLNPLPTDVVVTFECDEQEIDGTKKWWNGTDWVSPAPKYCGCTQTSDCDTANDESCIENICVTIKEPILNFIPYSSISIMVGETEEIVLDIRNDMSVTDHIEITIDKSQEISNWAWFKDQKNVNPHTKTVSIAPESNKKVIMQILGGKTGSYNLIINSKSILTLKEGSKEAQIRIIPKVDEDGNTIETTNTPGLSWLGFIAIMIMGLFVFSRNNKL